MAMPRIVKDPKEILNIYDNDKYMTMGIDRVSELMIKTDTKTKYLPRSIDFKDVDTSIYDLVNNGDLKLIIDDAEVPVFYMENERWGEFSKTWKFMDDDKNVPTPYITVRRSGKSKGTRMGNKSLIPQQKLFRYLDVPINDEGQIIYLRYKMPQPINVDLKYEITLFTNYRDDVNKYDKLVLKKFSSTQLYVFIKGTPIPILLDEISEPKTVENIEGDKFYVCKYPITAKALSIDENEFEITKTSRKPFITNSLY